MPRYARHYRTVRPEGIGADPAYAAPRLPLSPAAQARQAEENLDFTVDPRADYLVAERTGQPVLHLLSDEALLALDPAPGSDAHHDFVMECVSRGLHERDDYATDCPPAATPCRLTTDPCEVLRRKLVSLLNSPEADKAEKDAFGPLIDRQAAAGKLDWLTRQEQRLRAELTRRRENATARRRGLAGVLQPAAPLPATCPACGEKAGYSDECATCHQLRQALAA